MRAQLPILLLFYNLMMIEAQTSHNILPKFGAGNKTQSKPHKSLLTFTFTPTPALNIYLFT